MINAQYYESFNVRNAQCCESFFLNSWCTFFFFLSNTFTDKTVRTSSVGKLVDLHVFSLLLCFYYNISTNDFLFIHRGIWRGQGGAFLLIIQSNSNHCVMSVVLFMVMVPVGVGTC